MRSDVMRGSFIFKGATHMFLNRNRTHPSAAYLHRLSEIWSARQRAVTEQ